jgi:hypothetical protein
VERLLINKHEPMKKNLILLTISCVILFFPSCSSQNSQSTKESELSNPSSLSECGYHIEGDYVSFLDTVLEDANPNNFEILNKSCLAKDDSFFYCGVKKIDFHLDTMEIFAEGSYVKDKDGVYWLNPDFLAQRCATYEFSNLIDKNLFLINGADPKSFQEEFVLIENLFSIFYAKDKNYVYIDSIVIPGADPKTFEVLEGGEYAKDKNHVYEFGTIIEGVLPETFNLNSVIFFSGFPYENPQFICDEQINFECYGDCLDGVSVNCYFDSTKYEEDDVWAECANLIRHSNAIPEKSVAFQFSAQCSPCQNSFKVNRNGSFEDVSCDDFFKFINNLNAECSGCIKNIYTDCC